MQQISAQKGTAIILIALTKKILSLLIILFLSPAFLYAQSGSNNNSSKFSELVFQNPKLISGKAGQDGAVYRFKNVVPGTDATVKIVGRSSSAVVLSSIDTANVGWSKAFQPVLGIPGYVPRYQNWWMEFQMRFYKGNSANPRKMDGFQVTAIDVDGDGESIREYLQMNRTSSDAYSSLCYLAKQTAGSILTSFLGEDPDNDKGKDIKIVGPTRNFGNIDTAATSVMATFTYTDKDMISFRFGGTSGYSISNAGERLNSLWFKSFSLAPQQSSSTLPLHLINFQGNVNENKVNLNWTVADNETGHSFELEKSFDGEHFTTDALIFTTTKSGSENYFYKGGIDRTSFYRLKMINKDNSISYSKIIRLSVDGNAKASQITILQNPVGSSLQFSYTASSNETSVVTIYTITGMKVFSTQVQSQKGTNTFQLSLNSKINTGSYLLEIAGANERSITRFIKQ